MERPSGRRRAALRRSPYLLLLLLSIAGLAGPARALTLGDIEPLYFDGPGGQGFSASAVAATARTPAVTATPSDLWLAPGSASGLPISISLGTIHQNPSSPSPSNPLIADSTWTLRNNTGATLLSPLLVFTGVDPQHAYPITPPATGLDADLLMLLRYSFSNQTYLYGAIALPTLHPGESTDVTVRYVVAGALAPGKPARLPPLGVQVLGSYSMIPEPTTAVLVCVGLVALTARARRQRG